MSILKNLIGKDYELVGYGRWLRCSDDINNPSSLVIDTEKDVFYYNSRGIVGDALTWLTKVKGYSFEQAKQILNGYGDFSESYVVTIKGGRDIVVLPRLVDVFWE